jgi:hypothetical protein
MSSIWRFGSEQANKEIGSRLVVSPRPLKLPESRTPCPFPEISVRGRHHPVRLSTGVISGELMDSVARFVHRYASAILRELLNITSPDGAILSDSAMKMGAILVGRKGPTFLGTNSNVTTGTPCDSTTEAWAGREMPLPLPRSPGYGKLRILDQVSHPVQERRLRVIFIVAHLWINASSNSRRR